jgi:CRP-like cAMP-binding protein
MPTCQPFADIVRTPKMTYEKILSDIENNYSNLPTECKVELQLNSKILTVDKETTLVKEGQYADKTYFIVNGCARAYYIKDGKDITDWFAFENDFINSINSYFQNILSPHYIEVLEQSIVLEIPRDIANKLAKKYIEFERLEKTAITKTMLQLQARIVSMQFETAQQKYENLVKVKPDITQRVPLTHIASFLGITLETLSRIRNTKNRI